VCLADNYAGGIPLTSVHSGTVSGGVYCDSYYGTEDQQAKVAKTIEKTFTVPANAEIEWAMLLTTVYCGNMQNNYQGTASVSFNGKTLGTETLNVPFTYLTDGGNDGKGYVKVNDHVDRVTSDYMMYYDVTSSVKSGENKAVVKTEPADNQFDGRVKLITLVVAYNDGSEKKIWYQVNRGHDIDTYYNDEVLGENYVGSTAFQADLPEGSSLTDAKLSLVHMASTDGAYTFNGKSLVSGTPQGNYCGSNTWDVKDSFKPEGTNTVSYDRTDSFYKSALGVLTAEYTTSSDTSSSDDTTDDTSSNNTADDTSSDNTTDDTSSDNTTDDTSSDDTTDDTSSDNTTDDTSSNNTSGEVVSVDLGVQGLKVSHNNVAKAWDNLNNTVNVTVINNGPKDAGSFVLELYSDETLVESKPSAGLSNGATGSVEFIWKPEEAKNYTLKAVVVPGSTISDSVATNNEVSTVQEVMHNGYAGDKPLETYLHGTVKGDLIYDYGNSSYSNKMSPGSIYTVGHSLDLPEGATVKFARLYNFWTWSATGNTGVYPSMSLTFEGNTLTPEAEYSDQKGWGTQYNFPAGTWTYNVTGLVNGEGTYTTTATNTNSDSKNYFCIDGIALLVVYEDASGKEIEYWINEGCDVVSTMSSSGGLTSEEATVKVPFEGGSIDLSNVDEARLWTTVQSGGHTGISLKFNEMNVSGIYGGVPYSDLDIDKARDVKNYLLAQSNEAQIIAPSVTDNSGDYLNPSSAILAVTYKSGTTIDTNETVDDTNETVDDTNETVDDTNETVDDTNETVDDTNETVDDTNETVDDTNETTDDANETENDTDGETDNTNGICESGSCSSASVSLSVNIKPVVSLTVSPSSIDFGTVSAGTPSKSIPLTLQNNGVTGIKVTADVEDQENGPFETGLELDQILWSAYNKIIASKTSETSQVQLDLPGNYSSVGEFNGSLIFWAETV
jgi:hypothetical protein